MTAISFAFQKFLLGRKKCHLRRGSFNRGGPIYYEEIDCPLLFWLIWWGVQKWEPFYRIDKSGNCRQIYVQLVNNLNMKSSLLHYPFYVSYARRILWLCEKLSLVCRFLCQDSGLKSKGHHRVRPLPKSKERLPRPLATLKQCPSYWLKADSAGRVLRQPAYL